MSVTDLRPREEFLHYIWVNHLFKLPLRLGDGTAAEVLDTGWVNRDAGPDFFNAKIRIEKTTWAGNVEMHLAASDWYKHKHHLDPSYNNVILHLVLINDTKTINSAGQEIQTAVMNFDNRLIRNYSSFINNYDEISCKAHLKSVSPVYLQSWLDRLLAERLETRSEIILNDLQDTVGNWREVVYRQVARNFGQKINEHPFEILSRLLPLGIVERYGSSLTRREALFFGQAGFLSNKTGDSYYRKLRNEFFYLSHMLELKPMKQSLWKYFRLRPGSFPDIRIAQFVWLSFCRPDIFSGFLEVQDPVELITGLDIKTSAYWDTHYCFNRKSPLRQKRFGKSSLQNVIVNSLVPLRYSYDRYIGNDGVGEWVTGLLQQIPAEENHIIRKWKSIGIGANDRFTTQALLQLRNNYCIRKKCMSCQLGNHFIQKY